MHTHMKKYRDTNGKHRVHLAGILLCFALITSSCSGAITTPSTTTLGDSQIEKLLTIKSGYKGLLLPQDAGAPDVKSIAMQHSTLLTVTEYGKYLLSVMPKYGWKFQAHDSTTDPVNNTLGGYMVDLWWCKTSPHLLNVGIVIGGDGKSDPGRNISIKITEDKETPCQ